MKHQEKKYRVGSFARIERLLKLENAKPLPPVVSTHFYANRPGSDVVKLVCYPDRNEIHHLKEEGGMYTLTERIPVATREAGFQYLRDTGYTTVSVVTMEYTDFEYDGGVVGLYLINDFLRSVILDYPEGSHRKHEEELGILTAETIRMPYNKYLEKIGRGKPMNLYPEKGTYIGEMGTQTR